ncbi:histidinol-phosphatase (PHP family) [Lachnotalea glycerini]|uniref:Histidinol-phosphatase n=1 Tax=Lachnotalea glycerini TaxID=1763509 RepID=A0A318EY71_9FIRM|nr:histidinol-phosphatase HisJ family protein [Lachnotalea glycerini]PXV96026.1 histidinol-phosphatase (PHP family) [Lachnotalea glycerini]
MYLADYHIHTKYSFDGYEQIEDICNMAMKRGINEIALTDHMDIFSDKPYESILDCDSLYQDIERAKIEFDGKLIIRKGVELGQPQANPAESRKFMEKYSLDFIIGSIHNIKDDIDVYEYDFKQLDCNEVYREYLMCLSELTVNYNFDVLGHLTYPLRYIYQKEHKRVDLKLFEAQFRELFKKVIERGKGIEVNTSGLLQPMNETMPPLSIIKLYKECGGEIITVGSDAHKIGQIGTTIKQGQELLKEAGFQYITIFENRKPSFKKI